MTTTCVSGPERLADLGLSVATISRVLRRADAETMGCSDLDPPIMEGLLRWARATRFLREELVPAGWTYDNPRNLARTIHPDGNFAIVIATGDEGTGLADAHPGPRNSRGYATAHAVQGNGQLSFDFGSLPDLTVRVHDTGTPFLRTWFLLFHPGPELFRVELSLPETFVDGRITQWTERVLVPDVPRVRTAMAALAPIDLPLDLHIG